MSAFLSCLITSLLHFSFLSFLLPFLQVNKMSKVRNVTTRYKEIMTSFEKLVVMVCNPQENSTDVGIIRIPWIIKWRTMGKKLKYVSIESSIETAVHVIKQVIISFVLFCHWVSRKVVYLVSFGLVFVFLIAKPYFYLLFLFWRILVIKTEISFHYIDKFCRFYFHCFSL